jgi:hypothetical protein
MLKDFKNHLKMSLEIRFEKNKKEFFSLFLPSLLFGLLAQLLPAGPLFSLPSLRGRLLLPKPAHLGQNRRPPPPSLPR